MSSLLNRLLGDNREADFSLARLQAAQPALAAQFLWSENLLPDPLPHPWLHWGCGSNVLEDFTNVDFIQHPNVIEWDFLDRWPVERGPLFNGSFSEDTLEHFFLAEQQYILCSMNLLLHPGATARLLMPSYERLRELAPAAVAPGGFLRETFGVTTPVDGINMGLRFSGHRWLHDDASLDHLARECGFAAERSTCAQSREARFNGLNLRDETDSASFAWDLVKQDALTLFSVDHFELSDAEVVETLAGGIAVCRALQDDAEVLFDLQGSIDPARMVLVNIRSANLGEFRDHYYKRIRLSPSVPTAEWRLDETVKSKACMNLMTRQQLRQASRDCGTVEQILFRPASRAGQLFTLGPLELFLSEG
jgi:hypothetical protein